MHANAAQAIASVYQLNIICRSPSIFIIPIINPPKKKEKKERLKLLQPIPIMFLMMVLMNPVWSAQCEFQAGICLFPT